MSPSFNHAYIQVNLGALFKAMPEYSAFSELTLTINGADYVPDLVVYPKRPVTYYHDALKMTDIPLLIVEILSPTQGMQEIIDTFVIYLQAGVKSCWLVQPYGQSVMVWTSPETYTHVVEGDLVDNALGLRVPLAQIFA